MPKLPDPYPTKHLIEQLRERNVTWGEVVEIIEHPEVVYGPDLRGRCVVQKDDLSIVVGRDGAVITVLLRSEKQWTNEDVKTRPTPTTNKRK